MNSVKELLLNAIERLEEEEIQKTLEFVQSLSEKRTVSPTLERLKNDPAFKVPSGRPRRIHRAKPIQGKGIPASRLLIGDRR